MSNPDPTFADLVDMLDEQQKVVLKFVCSRITQAIFDKQPFLLLLEDQEVGLDEDGDPSTSVEIHSSRLEIAEARELLGSCASMLMDMSANTEGVSVHTH
jgi:hypothetical protein